MHHSYLTKSLSISPLMEILKRVLIYYPVLTNLYFLRQDYLPTFLDSSNDHSRIAWILKVQNFAEPLSIISFVLTLVTFEKQYTLRKVITNKDSKVVKIKFNGIYTASANIAVNFIRFVYFFIAPTDTPPTTALYQKYLQVGIVLMINSTVSLCFSLFYVQELSETRAVLYYKLCRLWKNIHSYVVSTIFVLVCFVHSNYLVRVIFRVAFLVISFKQVVALQSLLKSFIKVSFVKSLVDMKALFLILATAMFYECFRIIEFIVQKKNIEMSFRDVITYDYIAALVLYMLCCRNHYYGEINFIINNILYGNSHEFPVLNAAFSKKDPIVIRMQNQFSRYFLDRAAGILTLRAKDLQISGDNVSSKYLRTILAEAPDIKNQFILQLKTKQEREQFTKQRVNSTLKTKFIEVDQL